MKVLFTFLVAGTLALSSCQKEINFLGEEPVLPIPATCQPQTANPNGNSYTGGISLTSVTYSKNNCGLIPLSSKNYWVYLDSVYSNGVFSKLKYDTLRFTSTWKTSPDELIWWGSNLEIGIPEIMYSNDSTIFGLEARLFDDPSIKYVRKDFSLFTEDSIHYLANFDDVAAQGRSVKIPTTLKTPAGNFTNCVYVDKNARNYRRDQVIIKPGVGVVKYILEEAQMSDMERELKLQKVMTLIAFHLE